MKKVILALLFFAALSLCDASAQGLKGAPITSGNHREYKLAKVKGSSDLERWKNVAKIGPNLIGMSKRDVEAALGKGAFYIKDETLVYAVTGERDRQKGSYCYTALTIHFRGEHVDKFSIESVDWG